jgi:mono/diheme cytochrome c family protein
MLRLLATLAALLAGIGTRAETPVSFTREVAPLLQRRCAACHGEENAKGGYRLDTFAALLKPGDSDLPALTAGKPDESELWRLLIETDPHDRMPQKADALPAAATALIERWIREGAAYDGGNPARPLAELARASLLRAAPERYARPAPVAALAFGPDGSQLAVSGYYEVTIWNVADGSLARRVGGVPERITSIAWHAKRDLIALAGGSPAQWGTVALVEPGADFAVRFLCDLPDTALAVAFSPDGSRIVAGAADRSARIFDTVSGKTVRTLKLHADWVNSVAFSPDGSRIVTASRDRTARIFDAKSGEARATYTGHDAPLVSAIFTSENVVASLARNRQLHQWDANSGKRTAEFTGFDADIEQIAATKAGLFTAGADMLVRVHQVTDRRQLFALAGHGDVVQSLAVSRDGSTVASGAADGTVCIWNLACGTWAQRFIASPGFRDRR